MANILMKGENVFITRANILIIGENISLTGEHIFITGVLIIAEDKITKFENRGLGTGYSSTHSSYNLLPG